MTDVVDAKTRSRMMAGIKGKNSEPEMLVRRALFKAGFRFRLHWRGLPGVPDVVLRGRRVAVFVHGCFWHMHPGCSSAKLPSTRPEFWLAKLSRNADRDREVREALCAEGWRVLTVWECATRGRGIQAELAETLRAWIDGATVIGEISRIDTPR